jgi:transposase
MLTIPTNTRISFCTSPVDMRKSFNGLIGIVRNELNADPLAGHLFVFLNRNNTLMKILYYDGDGYAIWFKRLESGTFRFPVQQAGVPSIEITRSGLSMILEGIDLSQLPKRKRFSPERMKNPLGDIMSTR